MIGLYEFNQLELSKQKEIVWKQGIFLTNRKENNLGLSLYKVSDFYAEVHLNNDANVIEKIRTFKSVEPLAPYLDEIDLNKLDS